MLDLMTFKGEPWGEFPSFEMPEGYHTLAMTVWDPGLHDRQFMKDSEKTALPLVTHLRCGFKISAQRMTPPASITYTISIPCSWQ